MHAQRTTSFWFTVVLVLKPYMMVALIHFVIQVIQFEEKISQAKCSIRLLVACSTNVAVDRVLKTLQDSGYSDFNRVVC